MTVGRPPDRDGVSVSVTRAAYQKLFRERRVEKTCEAIAPWRAELMAALMYQHAAATRGAGGRRGVVGSAAAA